MEDQDSEPPFDTEIKTFSPNEFAKYVKEQFDIMNKQLEDIKTVIKFLCEDKDIHFEKKKQ